MPKALPIKTLAMDAKVDANGVYDIPLWRYHPQITRGNVMSDIEKALADSKPLHGFTSFEAESGYDLGFKRGHKSQSARIQELEVRVRENEKLREMFLDPESIPLLFIDIIGNQAFSELYNNWPEIVEAIQFAIQGGPTLDEAHAMAIDGAPLKEVIKARAALTDAKPLICDRCDPINGSGNSSGLCPRHMREYEEFTRLPDNHTDEEG